MDHFDGVAHEFVQSLLDNGVRLAATHLHERPRPRRLPADTLAQAPHNRRFAILVEVLHATRSVPVAAGGTPVIESPFSATSRIQSSSSSWLNSFSTAYVRRASASSTREIANPTCTMT